MKKSSLKKFGKMFWKNKLQVVLILIIFILIGIIYMIKCITPEYSSSTTIIVNSSNNNSETTNPRLISTYRELVKSKSILRKVINNLEIDMDEVSLRKCIKLNAVKNTQLIKITATHEDKYYAANIANETGKEFIKKVKNIYNVENIQVIDEAEIADKPSNIRYVQVSLIFVLIGLWVSGFYILIETISDTKKETEVKSEYETMMEMSSSEELVKDENEEINEEVVEEEHNESNDLPKEKTFHSKKKNRKNKKRRR